MKKILTLLAAYSLSAMSFVVFANDGKVNGTVLTGEKPLEAATVSLLNATDSSLVKMALSTKGGGFEVEKVAAGKYLVSVSAVGFGKYYSEGFEISPSNSNYTVKSISLVASSKSLRDVTVTTKKPFVEQKLDRTLINVEASTTNVGLTALEVLEKSPGISVDKDGNISLKGKAGVMVMVDGKPTYLSAQDLANMLKSMPSNQLEQIEIMTNPPAKYDASGNAGVINIKTKKNKTQGFNGSVTLGAGMGSKPKSSNSVNLNYRAGKFNLFGNYSHNYNRNFQDLNLTRNFRDRHTDQILTVFDQYADMQRSSQNHSGKIGTDYFATKKTTVGVVLTGFINPTTNTNDNSTFIKDAEGNLLSRTEAKNSGEERWKNTGANFNFRHLLNSNGREITADIDYLSYNKTSEQRFDNYFFDKTGAKKQPDEFLRGNLPSVIDIYSAKVDYTHPLKKDAKFEVGFKTSFVETDNNAKYENLISGNWQLDQGRSNHFVYKENVNALYVNGTKQFNTKWSGQLGLRLENTVSKGNQLTTGQNFNRNYTQLFPTAYLGYTTNPKNSFSLSYGRRINRPNYQDLNPFYYFLDKYTYELGNPFLKPQFSHNVDLNHSFKAFLNTSLNYNSTNDIIQQVLEQVDSTNTTFIRRENIAKRTSIGISVSANMQVTKWWRANIYTNVVNNHFEGLVNGAMLNVDGATFTTNVSNQFTFKKGWSGEISAFYRSKGIEGTLVAEPMGAVNFGIGKQVLNNKGSVRLNVRDFLDIQKFRGYSRFQNVDMKINNQWDNRVVNVSFSYRFGKATQSGPQRKKGSTNEEQSRINTAGQ
jgi:iron complex outermembrane receptor protein